MLENPIGLGALLVVRLEENTSPILCSFSQMTVSAPGSLALAVFSLMFLVFSMVFISFGAPWSEDGVGADDVFFEDEFCSSSVASYLLKFFSGDVSADDEIFSGWGVLERGDF